MIIDLLENWASYPFGEVWKCAFEFLLSIKDNKNIEEKKYVLQGEEIFAIVMSYETRSHETAVLESHRKYIDIQTAIVASEGIEWFPASSLDVLIPYNEKKDVEFYIRPKICPSRVDIYPGTFAMLFPHDAHMPQLIVNNSPSIVKKVVVKIKKSCLR